MNALESELERARNLSVSSIKSKIEAIGFQCTHCGECCRGTETDPHVATVFPDEVRSIDQGDEWNDVARPMPFGLDENTDGSVEGETFEWSLQSDPCGDCVFYDDTEETDVGCEIYANRPLICRTYPFSISFDGVTKPQGNQIEQWGTLSVHECEGIGLEISADEAEDLARTLKRRTIREIEEAIEVTERYRPVKSNRDTVVVHDSEGPKREDGTSVDDRR